MRCRVCAAPIAEFALSIPAPGLTSLTTPLDAPTQVAICTRCGHGQSPEPVELAAFYDSDYRISLQTEDFDQLHSVEHGKPVFRTDRQVQVLLNLVEVAKGARVLDYGAAKAQSTRRLLTVRPDLLPSVFDVSTDYRQHWREWITDDRTATYTIPEQWYGTFDLVTTYFVLEHVAEPTTHLSELRKLLKPSGKLFVIVPDPLTNTGDVLILDHVNHFTRPSLIMACALAGLRVTGVDDAGFTGGLAIAAIPEVDPPLPASLDVESAIADLKAACSHWHTMRERLLAKLEGVSDRPLALHGAGFYGSLVMQQIGEQFDVQLVLDANPHLQGGAFFGRPVVAPAELPDQVETVVVALNPAIAREVVGDGRLYGHRIEAIFLDGG